MKMETDPTQGLKSPAIAAAIAGDSCWGAAPLGELKFDANVCEALKAGEIWRLPLNGLTFRGR